MARCLIAPSILSANFAALGEEVKSVIAAGADMIHVDVMDNHYVPNLTVGPLVCQSLRKAGVTAPFDVHLMTKPVDSLVIPFAAAGASLITFHPEASEHIDRTIQLIHDQGCKAGLAFNPATPLHYLNHTLNKIDLILIMSVNPGFGGQTFIESALDKIQAARRLIDAKHLDILLAVDGGINPSNAASIIAAGANLLVVGSALFQANNYADIIHQIKNK
jgi:ribulose-phosphate 3-epimerase